MKTFTTGHAAFTPHQKHELPAARPLRLPAPGGTIKARVILCTNEEHHWIESTLAKRRGQRARAKLRSNQAR